MRRSYVAHQSRSAQRAVQSDDPPQQYRYRERVPDQGQSRPTKAELAAMDDGRVVPLYQRKASVEGVSGTLRILVGVEKLVTAEQIAGRFSVPSIGAGEMRALADFVDEIAVILEDIAAKLKRKRSDIEV